MFQRSRSSAKTSRSRLIAEAFHVHPDSLSGLPSWTETERFDIVAKAPPNTSPEGLRSMMRALLEDRFKLAAHADKKMGRAFALVASQKAQSLRPSAPARAVDGGCRRRRAAVSGDFALVCEHMSMPDLADLLPDAAGGYLDAPVVDQTGIEGFYDFDLFWTPARLVDGSGGSGAPSAAGSGTTVFHALQDQLGLKLEPRKLPLPIVVIDHIERPAIEN